MSNNLDQIVDCLDSLMQAPLRPHGVALGDCDDSLAYLCLGSGPALYAEVLGALPEAGQPNELIAQSKHLTDLGWNPPLPGDVHWYRLWQVESKAERFTAAVQMQRTLEAAYGIGVDQPLTVHFTPN